MKQTQNNGKHRQYYFWRNYHKKEVDLVEVENTRLKLFEFKWKAGSKLKSYRVPTEFTNEEFHIVTQEDLDTVIADVMTPNEEDIVLPEVDMSQIKIKEVPETLSGEDAVEQHRQDAVEYLTLVSYIFISNSPAQIRDMSGLKSFLLDSSNKVILGMLSGNYTFMDSLEEMGKKSLDEVEKIEVPESMLDTHVKTIKLLTFASTLKASIKASLSPNDPIGQMYTLSKVQGFLMTFDSYTQETQGILTAIGVKNIPLDI